MDSGSRGCAVVRSECVGFRKAYFLFSKMAYSCICNPYTNYRDRNIYICDRLSDES
jgi:hypothetical protein